MRQEKPAQAIRMHGVFDELTPEFLPRLVASQPPIDGQIIDGQIKTVDVIKANCRKSLNMMKSGAIENEEIVHETSARISEILGNELPILNKLVTFVIESGGKRVRSIIACYFAEMFSGISRDAHKISAIVEIIHAASLLHDDVLDDADTRRGKPSGKNIFGSKEVILGGDYMFATAIRSLNDFENPALMDIFTRVIRDLSVAELLQLEYERKPDITMENYLQIIYGKTGSLFQTACEGIAIHMKRSPDEITLCAEIGKLLGMLFQMRDDYLDYFNSALLNKPPYQDFENGLFTLPILLVRDKMGREDRDELLEYFNLETKARKDKNTIARFLGLLEKNQAREICLEKLKHKEIKLLSLIDQLPAHPFKTKIESQIKKLMQI
ncbi:MAG: polyprenyl synthetase family protein [Spirochaetia bacterium]|nr:polyprenyl synthetase family protein [Spirochaetia bacterium]